MKNPGSPEINWEIMRFNIILCIILAILFLVTGHTVLALCEIAFGLYSGVVSGKTDK